MSDIVSEPYAAVNAASRQRRHTDTWSVVLMASAARYFGSVDATQRLIACWTTDSTMFTGYSAGRSALYDVMHSLSAIVCTLEGAIMALSHCAGERDAINGSFPCPPQLSSSPPLFASRSHIASSAVHCTIPFLSPAHLRSLVGLVLAFHLQKEYIPAHRLAGPS